MNRIDEDEDKYTTRGEGHSMPFLCIKCEKMKFMTLNPFRKNCKVETSSNTR